MDRPTAAGRRQHPSGAQMVLGKTNPAGESLRRMNNSSAPPETAREIGPEDKLTALFAELVMRQTNMALICLGQVALPDSQERKVDLEAAELFIDQLEMLQIKTRGHLTKTEEHLLQQNLMQLRLAYVQVCNQEASSPKGPPPPSPDAPPSTDPAQGSTASASAEDSRVKFTKKY
jgi:hypothetical protein